MSFPIVIAVSPSLDPDERQAYSSRGQLFDGAIDDRAIVKRSAQPLSDACRVLIGEGIDPATRVVMRHSGAEADALRSTVGAAAKLSVTEGDRIPRLVPWVPSSLSLGKPPMRRNKMAATTLAAA